MLVLRLSPHAPAAAYAAGGEHKMSRRRLDVKPPFSSFVGMAISIWGWVALGYHLASRLAYVLYVGCTLQREDRTGHLARRYGAEGGFRRFRRAGFIRLRKLPNCRVPNFSPHKENFRDPRRQ